jgi:hypothetical protein
MGKKTGWTTRIIFPRAWKPVFWVKILKLFEADPGWKNSDKGSGSATLI